MMHHPNPLVMVPMIGGLLIVAFGFFAERVLWMLLGILLYQVGSYCAVTYSFDIITRLITNLDRRIDDLTIEKPL